VLIEWRHPQLPLWRLSDICGFRLMGLRTRRFSFPADRATRRSASAAVHNVLSTFSFPPEDLDLVACPSRPVRQRQQLPQQQLPQPCQLALAGQLPWLRSLPPPRALGARAAREICWLCRKFRLQLGVSFGSLATVPGCCGEGRRALPAAPAAAPGPSLTAPFLACVS
jgi:hypothetical protein